MVGERRKVLTFPLFLPIQQHARIHALINSERKESLFELEDYPNISLSLSSIPGWLKMLRKIHYIIYIIIIITIIIIIIIIIIIYTEKGDFLRSFYV